MTNIILIIATSARMLVQMAKESGYLVLAIDLFTDLDTCQNAIEVQQVNSLSLLDIKPAVYYFLEKYQVSQFVYGSGFESHFGSLEFLSKKMQVLGNDVKIFKRMQDKREFFSQLKSQDIHFPAISFSKPESFRNWLIKPKNGVGGINIRWFKNDIDYDENVYWQQFVEGIPMSALFLADGSNSHLIAFNRQLVVMGEDQQVFIFSGVMSQLQMSEKNRAVISGWIKQLTKSYELRGINSLDFIFTPEQSYVLEINPRPSASMILYDAKLFALHVKACQGEMKRFNINKYQYQGYKIIFAQFQCTIPMQLSWPDWSKDRPAGRAIINAGQPICSIIADGSNQRMVLQKLQTREENIITKLKG